MNNPYQDRRKYTRYHLNTDIKLKFDGDTHYGHICNIGEGGLSFKSTLHFEMKKNVNVVFNGPNNFETLDLMGKIVWIDKKSSTYGIEFTRIPEIITSKIRHWGQFLVRA